MCESNLKTHSLDSEFLCRFPMVSSTNYKFGGPKISKFIDFLEVRNAEQVSWMI